MGIRTNIILAHNYNMSKKELIGKAITNIDSDRKRTLDLLAELQAEFANDPEVKHSRSGAIAAKYVETLQRSNEQLVKIISIMSKSSSTDEEEESLSEEDTVALFDLIQNGDSEVG